MKHYIVIILLLMPPLLVLAQENQTASYVNSVFYNNRVSVLRTSYDRWQTIFNKYMPNDPEPEKNVPIWATINDFNWGKDVNNKSIYPMTLGYALGKRYVRYYFLLSTSDAGDLACLGKKGSDRPEGTFYGGTVGINFNFKYLSLQGDATYSNDAISYYGKLFVPVTQTHIGVGFGQFDELRDSVVMIVKSKATMFNSLDVSTSYLKYLNLGFRYFALSKVKFVPNISTSLHQFIKFEKWATMPCDLELFFETRGEKLKNIFSMKDFETRLMYHHFISGPMVSKKAENSTSGITVRPSIFAGVSYKSEEDGYTQTLTESGKIYTGQHGIGIEAGIGLRVLGFTQFGFQDASYVKFSVFYNYSQYFERFPGIKGGVRFRVLM